MPGANLFYRETAVFLGSETSRQCRAQAYAWARGWQEIPRFPTCGSGLRSGLEWDWLLHALKDIMKLYLGSASGPRNSTRS